ncbi:hypothetical protein HU200_025278 [Digitaria exilis]|uniref:Uncharacterized protein n=1 Tax=Digitaria exilis TaxID=1010633 RepID=A0A835C0V1_9POAL|nr:hypothetical protein HU200_025278 [Digitaria exilis]
MAPHERSASPALAPTTPLPPPGSHFGQRRHQTASPSPDSGRPSATCPTSEPPPSLDTPLSPTAELHQRKPLPTDQSYLVDVALDIHRLSDSEDESPSPRRKNGEALKTTAGHGPPCSNVEDAPAAHAGHRGSYRDALMQPRTFKPRFPKVSSHHGEHVWLQEKVQAPRNGTVPVWERLGAKASSIHQRLGPPSSESQRSEGGHFLMLLKAKAGDRRCFNCLALDHRISQCRDPPKCILCNRSGQKARFCRSKLPRSCSGESVPAAPGLAAQPAAFGAATAPAAPRRREKEVDDDNNLMDLSGLIPGSPGSRPHRVLAAAPRTQALRKAERDHELHALVAVQVDSHVPLRCDDVRRDAPRQLRIPPERATEVTRLATATFLLRFDSAELRNSALSMGGLYAGGTGLCLMAWTRRFNATAGSLKFRSRVCLKGVPPHARQPESVVQLLSAPSFIDEIDYNIEKEDERSTFNIWVWTDAPSDLAVSGTLQIEEPVQPSDDYYLRLGNNELPPLRDDVAKTLDYNIIIHLDSVLDYTAPASPERQSFHSAISGVPDDEVTVEWPVRICFNWSLGYIDGLGPVQRPRRVSAHQRLGGRCDRSPPHGGAGGSGLGQQHAPAAPKYDAARPHHRGHGFGGGRNMAGGQGPSHRRNVGTDGGVVWRKKDAGVAKMKQRDEAIFQIAVDVAPTQCKSDNGAQAIADPMQDEAAQFNEQSDQPKCTGTRKAFSEQEHPVHEFELATPAPVCLTSEIERDPMLLELIMGKGHMFQHIASVCSADVDHGTVIHNKCLHAQEMEVQRNPEVCQKQSVAVPMQKASLNFEQADNDADLPDLLGVGDDLARQQQGPQVLVGVSLTGLQDGPSPPVVGLTLPFDLNQGDNVAMEELYTGGQMQEKLPAREPLVAANDRLNKETKNGGGDEDQRNVPKTKPKNPGSVTVAYDKKGKTGSSQLRDLSLDDQATAVLMMSSGIIGPNDVPTQANKVQFGEQFIAPMQNSLVGGMRETFGLPVVGPDSLAELINEADD